MNRSGVLPKKETMRIIEGLRRQGCRIRRMKKGYRVEFPNGGSTMFHLTNSDSRGTMNTRAEIKRAGLIYPGDEKQERTMKALATDTNEKLDAVLKRIDDEGKFYGSVQQMADDAGVHLVTMIRRLKDRGWTNERGNVNGKGTFIWYAPGAAPEWLTAPEKKPYKHPRTELLSDRSKAIVEVVNQHPEGISAADVAKEMNLGGDSVRVYLARAFEFGRITRPARGVYAPLDAEPSYPEIEKAKKIVQPNGKGSWPLVVTTSGASTTIKSVTSVTSPVTEPVTPKPENITAIPARVESKREFLDSVDSWTIPVPEKLARMAETMGLQIEVRVWR